MDVRFSYCTIVTSNILIASDVFSRLNVVGSVMIGDEDQCYDIERVGDCR